MIAVVASILVGLTFVVAGGSKIAAGPDWPHQARGLGAPPFVIPVLPWLEITIGALLVAQYGRRVAAVAAIALLVAFTAAIGRRLVRGEHPPCACFGAWSASPIGPRHLARNAALIALAVVALT